MTDGAGAYTMGAGCGASTTIGGAIGMEMGYTSGSDD